MANLSSLTDARVGRYRLVEQLGEGGMAVVYRALIDGPEGFSRSVVIKRVRHELSSQDSEFSQMLAHEARLCARLHHPSIVQVYELGKEGDEFYLAMEYIAGEHLGQILKRCLALDRPLPQGLVCYLVSEVAAALAYAHALCDESGQPLGLIHRDISPSNIMITPGGMVKVLDFGIAKAAHGMHDDETRSGFVKGKLSYMSPEQVEGEPTDQRSDIFSLGIVMHEALTLQRLFRGREQFETLRLVRDARAQPPSALRPELDADVDAVVLKMLARDPGARFADCQALVDALSPLVHSFHGDANRLRQFLVELGPLDSTRQSVGQESTRDGARLLAESDRTASTVLGPKSELARVEAVRRPQKRWIAAAAIALGAIGWPLWHHGSSASPPAPMTAAPSAPAPAPAPAPAAPIPVAPAPAPAPVVATPAQGAAAARVRSTSGARGFKHHKTKSGSPGKVEDDETPSPFER